MIGGIGENISSTYSQTPNRRDPEDALLIFGIDWMTISGLILVSRISDAGCTELEDKAPKFYAHQDRKSVV